MADAVNPTSSNNEAQAAQQNTAADPAAAGQAGTYDANTTISNVQQLRQQAPEVWNSMLKSMAMSMIRKMQRDNSRLKQAMRRMSNNDY